MKWVFLAAALAVQAIAAAPSDQTAGQTLFAACAVCHDTGHANKQGPGLGGIMGRKAATAAGFRYSGAMRRSGITWTPETLDAYLANPQGNIPGNVMPFAGLPDAAQRTALIAYLATLKG
jgi:cytochrome c